MWVLISDLPRVGVVQNHHFALLIFHMPTKLITWRRLDYGIDIPFTFIPPNSLLEARSASIFPQGSFPSPSFFFTTFLVSEGPFLLLLPPSSPYFFISACFHHCSPSRLIYFPTFILLHLPPQFLHVCFEILLQHTCESAFSESPFSFEVLR